MDLLASRFESRAAAGGDKPLRFRLTLANPFVARIDDVKAGGDLLISQQPGGPGGAADLIEGLYLGLAMPELKVPFENTSLLRVQVAEVGPNGSAVLRVAMGAASALRAGHTLILARPEGATTSEMKRTPELAPLVTDDGAGGSNGSAMINSINNLRQIALALHNFHDVYGRFPPAVVVGPDGRPWHSWRVLILPFLEQAALYERYKLDEPWDGPNNSKLLDSMPDIYRDPVHGQTGGHDTHYAAVTGKGMAFPPDGIRFDGKPQALFAAIGKEGQTFFNFTDGTSNSLMIGSVSPGEKIPWLKPADIVVGASFPNMGRPGGFAAPYKTDEGDAGVFAFADGSVRAIRSSIAPASFRKLLTIAGGETIGDDEVPTDSTGNGPMSPVIEIDFSGPRPVAHWKMEPIPQTDELPMPAPAPAPTNPPLRPTN
jgi:hypothetical protein